MIKFNSNYQKLLQVANKMRTRKQKKISIKNQGKFLQDEKNLRLVAQ